MQSILKSIHFLKENDPKKENLFFYLTVQKHKKFINTLMPTENIHSTEIAQWRIPQLHIHLVAYFLLSFTELWPNLGQTIVHSSVNHREKLCRMMYKYAYTGLCNLCNVLQVTFTHKSVSRSEPKCHFQILFWHFENRIYIYIYIYICSFAVSKLNNVQRDNVQWTLPS